MLTAAVLQPDIDKIGGTQRPSERELKYPGVAWSSDGEKNGLV